MVISRILRRDQSASLDQRRVPGRGPLVAVVLVVLAISGWAFYTMWDANRELDTTATTLSVDGGALRYLLTVHQGALRTEIFVVEQELAAAYGSTGPIPAEELFAAEAAAHSVQAAVAELSAITPANGSVLAGSSAALQAAFLNFVNTRTQADLEILRAAIGQLQLDLASVEPALDMASVTHFLALQAAVERSERMLYWTIGLSVPLVIGLILWMGVSYRRAVDVSQQRSDALKKAVDAQTRRNAQFAGLYQVVTEVNETLNLHYIVETTVSEAIRLVDADVVVLRVLEGDSLISAGCKAGEGIEMPQIPHQVALGEGLVGRAARRGKFLRTGGRNQLEFIDPEVVGDDTSGVVVPLIVGARVVGTLGCWAASPDHFSDDDIQLLEMMGSQVASAIAAANMQEQSDLQAHHDALTELPNRRQLEADIFGKYDDVVESQAPLAVAMVDIDHFKDFNDQYGHQAGDIALQRVAATLAASVRDSDSVYRYGGEEFVIVFDGMSREEASEASDRMLKAVAGAHIGTTSQQKVTISIGLATAPGPFATFHDVLGTADQALYRAKAEGRNRTVISDASPVARAA